MTAASKRLSCLLVSFLERFMELLELLFEYKILLEAGVWDTWL